MRSTSLITPLTPLHPTVQSVSSAALYCRCINTRPMVQQKRIRRLEVFPPAPHCSQTEIISGGGGVGMDFWIRKFRHLIGMNNNKVRVDF
uniref:Uncharacterized protein n=1 Tax=Paramormyrops kingsleyae TaxID=1676925 RepID=A0A3B3T3R5_9TELE